MSAAIPDDVKRIVERFTCEYASHLREIVQLDMALAIAADRDAPSNSTAHASNIGGSVSAPSTPTDAMLRAGVEAIHAFATSADRGFEGYHGVWGEEAMRIYSERLAVGYRAMIAAAPREPLSGATHG